MKNSPASAAAIFAAANNQYQGAKSVSEHGAVAHAERLARVFLRYGKAATELEAVALANVELQRLQWQAEEWQPNRIARDELRGERRRAAGALNTSSETGPRFVSA